MAGLLSLFPARVKFVNADGTLTNEAYRALQSLFIRVGGALGNFDFDTLTLTGNATIGGKLIASAGSVGAPSIYWGASNSTGFYQIAANNVGYSVSGVNVLNLLSTGLTVTGTTTSTTFVGAGTGLTGTAASLTAGNVTTNANLTGMVTSVGNATTVVTNANLTGPITSVGNATSVASQTGTGTTFVMQASPTLTTPNIGVATGTSLQAAVGNVTPNTGAFTTLSASGQLTNTRAAGADTTVTHVTTGINSMVMGFNNSGATNGQGVPNNHGYVGPLNAYNLALTCQGVTPVIVSTTGLAVTGTVTATGGATFITTSTALTNGAGASGGTLLNAPAAGNPTKWIGINDNGTTRYIPAW